MYTHSSCTLPLLCILAYLLVVSSVHPQEASSAEGNTAGSAHFNATPYHSTATFTGQIVQAPYILNAEEVLVFLDDRSILRYHFERGIQWRYSFLRRPLPRWHIEETGHAHASDGNIVYIFDSQGLIAKYTLDTESPHASLYYNEIVHRRLLKANSVRQSFSENAVQLSPVLEDIQEDISVYHTKNRLFLRGRNVEEIELLRIEEPWELQYMSYNYGQVFLSDSKWRLHRVNLREVVEDSRGAEYYWHSEENKALASEHVRSYFLALLESPQELRLELQRIAADMEQNRGIDERLAQALVECLQTVYLSGRAQAYFDHNFRARLLASLLQYSTSAQSLRIAGVLKHESEAPVFTALLAVLPQKSTPVCIEAVRSLLHFMSHSNTWHGNSAFLRSSLSFIEFMQKHTSSEDSELKSLLDSFVHIYYSSRIAN